MLLSQKINELREQTNKVTGFSQEMMDGFNQCIEDAERLEGVLSDYIKLENKISESVCEICEKEKLHSDNLCKECFEKLPC